MSLPSVLRDRLRLPVIASPLFIVSGADLVIAQSKAGVIGSFPSLNARPQPELRVWLTRITEELAKHDYHIVYEDDLLLGRMELETWTDKKYAIQVAGHELSRARGGPRCMTMPLEREDV